MDWCQGWARCLMLWTAPLPGDLKKKNTGWLKYSESIK
jgi:hypothetical protein